MRKTNKEVALTIIQYVGGVDNIISNAACMTRLHIRYKNSDLLDIEAIKTMKEVLGVVHGDTLQIVFGPGKVSNVGNELALLTKLPLEDEENTVKTEKQETETSKALKARKNNRLAQFFKHFANIFLPILPGIAGAGLINGIVKAINVANHNALVEEWWYATIMTVGWALFAYLPIFVGMNAAKEFKGTPILGGIGGALSVFNDAMPLLSDVGGHSIMIPLTNAVYDPTAGGIFAAVLTGIGFAYIERAVKKMVPPVLGMFLTPLLTLIIGFFISLFVFQPLGSIITSGLFILVDIIFEQMGVVGGFILSTIQLPLVSVGLHRVFTPIHTLLSDPSGPTNGINYLLPILMVAGGGQVGAALALYLKTNNQRLKKAIVASVPAGILGVGEPLMYSVMLPLAKPFLMACIGSGFGGMIISLFQVGSISQGVSGVLAPLIMNPGSQVYYLLGLITAYFSGFILTYLFGYDEENCNIVFEE